MGPLSETHSYVFFSLLPNNFLKYLGSTFLDDINSKCFEVDNIEFESNAMVDWDNFHQFLLKFK